MIVIYSIDSKLNTQMWYFNNKNSYLHFPVLFLVQIKSLHMWPQRSNKSPNQRNSNSYRNWRHICGVSELQGSRRIHHQYCHGHELNWDEIHQLWTSTACHMLDMCGCQRRTGRSTAESQSLLNWPDQMEGLEWRQLYQVLVLGNTNTKMNKLQWKENQFNTFTDMNWCKLRRYLFSL